MPGFKCTSPFSQRHCGYGVLVPVVKAPMLGGRVPLPLLFADDGSLNNFTKSYHLICMLVRVYIGTTVTGSSVGADEIMLL